MGSKEREQEGHDWVGNSQSSEESTNIEPAGVTSEAQDDPTAEATGRKESTLTQMDGGLYGEGDTRKDNTR